MPSTETAFAYLFSRTICVYFAYIFINNREVHSSNLSPSKRDQPYKKVLHSTVLRFMRNTRRSHLWSQPHWGKSWMWMPWMARPATFQETFLLKTRLNMSQVVCCLPYPSHHISCCYVLFPAFLKGICSKWQKRGIEGALLN